MEFLKIATQNENQPDNVSEYYQTLYKILKNRAEYYSNDEMYFLPLSAQSEDGKDLNYAALHFDNGKPSRGKIKRQLRTEESVYSQVMYM